MPHVATEQRTEGDIVRTIYRTPVGSVSEARTTHHERLSDSGAVQVEWMVKRPENIPPVIFMVDDTVYHLSPATERNVARDLGDDGINKAGGMSPPYDSSERYFGLENWIYAQRDQPAQFERLLAALERRLERLAPLVLGSGSDFVAMGSVSGNYGPETFRQRTLPFYQTYVPLLQAQGKACAIHAHNSNLAAYRDLICETGCRVVEAYTPPPISDLPIAEARAAWGDDVVIWVNFPETVFYEGAQRVRDYTRDLLESDAPGDRLVVGFTEMGLFGIVDEHTERAFKSGFMAIAETINQYGRCPIAAPARA
jgi:hypothetical protein